MRSVSEPGTIPISKLREDLRGEVIAPEDAGYDAARTVFSGEHRPAAGGRSSGRSTPRGRRRGVARARLRHRAGCPERRPQRAGHSASREGGIVLDLSAMKALDIDADDRTAWAETGLTAGEYTDAAGPTRTRDRLRRYGLGGHRRHHARRRDRLPRAEVRHDDRRPPRRGGRDRGRRVATDRRRERTPTSSGRSAAAAATSASPRGSGSGCTTSRRSWAGS